MLSTCTTQLDPPLLAKVTLSERRELSARLRRSNRVAVSPPVDKSSRSKFVRSFESRRSTFFGCVACSLALAETEDSALCLTDRT